MNKKPTTSRRKFIAGAASAIAAPAIIPSSVLGADAPSNKINMGFVGMGNRGRGVMTALMNHKQAQGIAVCDLENSYTAPNDGKTHQGVEAGLGLLNGANKKKGGSETGVKGYSDFREMIANEDLDAIMVATPDHWHALVCMEALKKGIDVYCEKPITHLFAEGYHLHREVAKQGRIFQVGSQQRSDKRFRHAVEIVRNGNLGKIQKVEVGLPPGKDSAQGETVGEIPAGFDYDMWCGPSEKIDFMPCRYHWNWRWHLNFGGGQLMDWIGHHNDIAHWGLGMDKAGPLSVEAKNFEYVSELMEVYNSPRHYDVVSQYPGDIEVIMSSRNTMGTKWIGENGWVYVTRGKIEASNPEWVATSGDKNSTDFTFNPGEWKGYHPGNGHQSNFVQGVIDRKECICPAETGHRSATPGHIAYVSQKLGRAIKWDSKAEKVIGDDEAQKELMALPYRGDWKLI